MTSQRRPQQRRNGSQPTAAAEVAVTDAGPQESAAEPTADAEPATAADARQDPLFRVSGAVLREMLRLHPTVTITGVEWVDGILELRVNVPGMPADAVELLVSYRRTGGADPIWPVSTWRRAEPGKAAS